MSKLRELIYKYSIDGVTLFVSVSAVLVTAIFILSDEEFAKTFIQNTYEHITNIFGSSYLILTLFCFFFLIALSITKY